MKFVTLNPRTKNTDLIKDVGMIPYCLHYIFGVDATVVSYKNEKAYPYLNNEVKGLKAEFIKKIFGRHIDGMIYVLKNAKNIDVLNLYHLNAATLLAEIAYKLKNRNGKIYLKLDISKEGLRTLLLKDPRGFVKRLDIMFADIVSCETRKIYKVLRDRFGDKILYIANGCMVPKGFEISDNNTDNNINSENTILTVSNFGTREKASDILLKAFIDSAKKHDYNLKVIGTVEEAFKPYIKKLIDENPDMENRIQFLGNITDRKALFNEYKKAKIFVLPSRQESFGIVLVEAACEGCYLISTKAVAAGYDVSDNGRYGDIVKTDDIESLSNAFLKICTDKNFDFNKHACEIATYASLEFCWGKIVTRLYNKLKGSKKGTGND